MAREDKDDWFVNVENIKPVRGGRRAAALSKMALSTKKVGAREAEDKFREEFAKASESEDPLAVVNEFLNWFQEQFPSGKASLLYPMLYKVAVTYGNDERYQQDQRLLKIWTELCENFPERGLAVMDFAYSKGSCRQMAKFYIRWSEMYDNMGQPNRAREKLELGIYNHAVPLDVLHEARDKLEMRLMRDTIIGRQNEDSDYEEVDMDYGEDGEPELVTTTRRPIGQLRGLGDASEAPMIRKALATPLGPLKGLPQSTPQSTFRVYEEHAETPRQPAGSTKKQKRIADEFSTDPDYQALFGFFDHRPKSHLELSQSENSFKPLQWTECAIKELPELPPPSPGFEIYTDEPEPEPQSSFKTPKAKRPAAVSTKAKMKLRKDFALEMSMEEGYAMLIENRKIHAFGDGLVVGAAS